MGKALGTGAAVCSGGAGAQSAHQHGAGAVGGAWQAALRPLAVYRRTGDRAAAQPPVRGARAALPPQPVSGVQSPGACVGDRRGVSRADRITGDFGVGDRAARHAGRDRAAGGAARLSRTGTRLHRAHRHAGRSAGGAQRRRDAGGGLRLLPPPVHGGKHHGLSLGDRQPHQLVHHGAYRLHYFHIYARGTRIAAAHAAAAGRRAAAGKGRVADGTLRRQVGGHPDALCLQHAAGRAVYLPHRDAGAVHLRHSLSAGVRRVYRCGKPHPLFRRDHERRDRRAGAAARRSLGHGAVSRHLYPRGAAAGRQCAPTAHLRSVGGAAAAVCAARHHGGRRARRLRRHADRRAGHRRTANARDRLFASP